MSEIRVEIIFEATTTSNEHNDGLAAVHQEVLYAWQNFTGGYINAVYSDPEWMKGRPITYGRVVPLPGVPLDRTFTTVCYLEAESAAALYLDDVGPDKFRLGMMLQNPGMAIALTGIGAHDLRLEVPE